MKYLFILMAFIALSAHAKTVQWSQGYVAGCDNPTERVDGTSLPLSEIYMVKYLIIPVGGTSSVYDVLMMGGCTDTFVDTKNLAPGEYEVHGITVDTSQPVRLESEASTPMPLSVQKSKPKPPAGLR